MNRVFRRAAALGALVVCVVGAGAARAQSAADFSGASYQQNFDGMGQGNISVSDAAFIVKGLISNKDDLAASTGNLNPGAMYNFGTTGAPVDRALGSIAANNTGINLFGLVLQNNTGATITNFNLSYVGEQYRNGGTTTSQKLDFSYIVSNTLAASYDFYVQPDVAWRGAVICARAVPPLPCRLQEPPKRRLKPMRFKPLFFPLLMGASVGLWASAAPANAQVLYGVNGGVYAQNFDGGYAPGPTQAFASDTTIAGVWSNRPTLLAGNGGDINGGLYAFRATGSAENALGTLTTSGTPDVYFGIALTNATPDTLTRVNLAYTGEQWRKGGATTPDSLVLEFILSFNFNQAVADQPTGYTDTGSGFASPTNTPGGAALDGNNPSNQVAVSGSITGLAWRPNQTLFLRWRDVRPFTSSNSGLAVDNLTVVAVPEPSALPLALWGLGMLGGVVWRRRAARHEGLRGAV